jgi:hypothetical protein
VRSAERAAAAALALTAAAAAWIAVVTWPRLFASTPAGVGRLVATRCEAAGDTPCAVKTLALGPGRHWLEATAAGAGRLVLVFEVAPVEARPQVLLLGASADGLGVEIELSGDGSIWRSLATSESGGGPRRRLVRFDATGAEQLLRISLTRPAPAPGPEERLRVEEAGLFASETGLRADGRGFLRGEPDRRVYNGILAPACLWLAGLGLLAVSSLPRKGRGSLVTTLVFFLTLAASLLTLYVEHNPYWYRARDLRVMLASGPLQDGVGANLNYGMYLGSRLLAGEGLTFGPGFVPWERMPGYGFFGAAAGLYAGFTTDLLAIGLASIELHLLLFAAANAALAAAAIRVMRPALAVAVSVLVCFMPNQLANTQADSVMVALYLLTAASLGVYLDRERASGLPPFRFHLMVHTPFALWFLTRPEGVVGWAAVSLLLYRRALRYLALPAALYLAIGLSWAGYKHQYTGEFSMTTNTVGDNAWIGLWQAPNKFRWKTADPSYFEWAATRGVPPTSKRASDTALREVARFAATYPVYTAHLVLFRFLQYVDVNALNGILNYPHLDYRRLRGAPVWTLLAVVALCLAVRHEPRRTLLLGWPLFFNLPLFLVFFSDGMRHVAPCTAALFVAALPPLLEGGFYRALLRGRMRALAIGATLLLAWPLAHWADRALLASEQWRYWTPILDPAPFAWYLR